MAIIKEFNSKNLDTVSNDIKAALAVIAKKHGISLAAGGIIYSSNQFTTKITALTTTSTGGEAVAPQEVKWAASFARNILFITGVVKTDLGKKIKLPNGSTVTLVGMRPKANLPFVGKKETGSYVALSESDVVVALKAA